MRRSLDEQPVVIFGGFLSVPSVYWAMRDRLAEMTGQPVRIVDAWIHDWVRSTTRAGWANLLGKLERAVRQLVRQSPTGKVTLVGHSSGGVVGRLYLSDRPFLGHTYAGLECVDWLITLGSPHHNRHGGQMRRWVDQQYPGAYFPPQVQYVCVAGKMVRGKGDGSIAQRLTYRFYGRLSGAGDAWGDGLVPIASAILPGSRQVILEGVSHFGLSRVPWYGSAEVMPRQWDACAVDGPASAD
jgi:pimeloyl-ACP methyl ester carboxylesterase